MKRAVPTGAALLAGVLLGVFLLVPASASAQGVCEAALRTASDLFDQGKFDAARQAALPCLDAKPTRVERSRTLSLLARIFLVQDDVAQAEAMLGRLLAADPDLPPHVAHAPPARPLRPLLRGPRSAP